MSAVAALALLGLTVTSWVDSAAESALRAHREVLLFTSIATLAAAAIVGALKHFSSHACPWDLAMFGGSATYHPLLGAAGRRPAVDGCFPAAHPLAGYAWLAVGLALYPGAPPAELASVGPGIRAGHAIRRRADRPRRALSCPTSCGRPGSCGA